MESPARALPRDPFGDGALLIDPSARTRPPERAQASLGAIRLSERAAVILQGLPEGWQIAGRTRRARWEQIATAVPPPLAEAVGRSVLAALGARRPARVVVRLPSARGEVRS
jgi:site-specific DNA-cytosine methylase